MAGSVGHQLLAVLIVSASSTKKVPTMLDFFTTPAYLYKKAYYERVQETVS